MKRYRVMDKKYFVLTIVFINCLTCCFIQASEVDLQFNMPSKSYSPGMNCGLDLQIINYGDAYTDARLYIALNIGTDEYWFYPDWVRYPHEVSWLDMDIPCGFSETVEIIPEFAWPEGVGAYEGITFLAVLDDHLGLISNLEMVEFEYVEHPEIRTISPVEGPPGTILSITGSGFDPTAQSTQVRVSNYPLNVLTQGIDSNGLVTVSSVIPFLEPGTYLLEVILDDEVTESVAITVKDFETTGNTPEQIMENFQSGFSNLCSIFELSIIPCAVSHGIIGTEDENAFLNTVQRSLLMFNGFTDLFNSFDQPDQELICSLLEKSDLYLTLLDLESPSSFGQDLTPAELLVALDTTSAVFNVLGINFRALETSLNVHLHQTSSCDVQIASLVIGCHMAMDILDYLIDGFIPTEVNSLGLMELGQTEPLILPVEEYVTYSLKGVFEVQDDPMTGSFTGVISQHLSGYPDWFKDQKNLIFSSMGTVIEDLGYELDASYLGDEILNLGSPPSKEFPLTINRFVEPYSLAIDLENSLFNQSQSMLSDQFDIFSFFSPETYLRSICSTRHNCLETQIEQEVITFRSLDCSTDSKGLCLSYFWYTYNSKGSVRNMESPDVQVFHMRYETECNIPKGFSYIPSGTFQMGTPETEICRDDDEGPVHTVTISRGFFMKHTEVTQSQWLRVMDSNPSEYGSANRPVEMVSWYAACAYCNRLSTSEGLIPCYYGDESFIEVYDDYKAQNPVYWNRYTNGYRLPTEAEWEYACRAGSTGPHYHGKPSQECYEIDQTLLPYAWHGGYIHTFAVATRIPNRWNLYDMQGNVGEWCWDEYDEDYYSVSPEVDPTGAVDGLGRILRGGSFYDHAGDVRCGTRLNFGESFRWSEYGFRIVKSLDQ